MLAVAALVPLLVVLAIGVQGVGLVLGWLVLTILLWLILAVVFPGNWGRAGTVAATLVSSLLAAIVVVSLLGR